MTRQEEILKGINDSWFNLGVNATSNTSLLVNGITANNPVHGRSVVLNFSEGLNVPKFTLAQVSSFKNVTDGQLAYITDATPAGIYVYIGSSWVLSQAQSNPFGNFLDTTTQTVAIDAIAAMKFNTTVESSSVSIVNDNLGYPTRITFATPGVYNIQFSAQLYRTSGGSSKDLVIWLRKGGVDVPQSSTKVTLQAGANYLVASWNFLQSISAAGEYYQIMWTQNDNIELLYEAANLTIPYPSIPSIILTVNKVN
jgi:hypothetical protein